MCSRASSLLITTPRSAAASRYQSARQLRQKPARIIRSMFCTSGRFSLRWESKRRKAAASSSVVGVVMAAECVDDNDILAAFPIACKRMTARILDGKRIADELLDDLRARVTLRERAGKVAPGL